MNPYPFALLNHFTVPFIRSTYPPLSARPYWGPKGRARSQIPTTKMHFGAPEVGCQARVRGKMRVGLNGAQIVQAHRSALQDLLSGTPLLRAVGAGCLVQPQHRG